MNFIDHRANWCLLHKQLWCVVNDDQLDVVRLQFLRTLAQEEKQSFSIEKKPILERHKHIPVTGRSWPFSWPTENSKTLKRLRQQNRRNLKAVLRQVLVKCLVSVVQIPVRWIVTIALFVSFVSWIACSLYVLSSKTSGNVSVVKLQSWYTECPKKMYTHFGCS
jgi:hypothetical protein